MHIPDGYLSPSTCAGLFAAAVPFWWTALRRVKKELHTRAIPLLSVFSAFSFVVMMFNLPLPGGTTGHAVGMGMTSIILGPWVSILSISIALLIQALFFGDGGITTLGANCFNMAIVGSLVAYAAYQLLSYRAAITSRRRVIAAGLAGYVAINLSALCAAVEFGIQPIFFHDKAGAPLYAPYPLSVAIPAMMLGHLTFAGLAELVLSAGIVAYVQRADPSMLRLASGSTQTPKTRRTLWAALAICLVLTPLGIIAVGGAWGEWHAKDFSDPAARQRIAEVSGSHAAPLHTPIGLERLGSIWQPVLPDYSPSFVSNSSLAYFVSASIGVLLILACSALLTRTIRRRRLGFLESTVTGLMNAIEEAISAENMAESKGFLQRMDARVKLAGIGFLIIAAVAVTRLPVLLTLFCFAVLLASLSKISLRLLSVRIWLAVLAFTGVIALPALFLVPGERIGQVPILNWTITLQGLTAASFLVLRAETAATFSLLLVLSTPWNALLRAFRFFRAPVVLVVILESTYRFVFVLLQTTNNMFESRSTRLVGRLQPSEKRRFAVSSAGALLDKSLQFSADVHSAMQARGFRGEAMLLDNFRMNAREWLQLTAFAVPAALAIWLGR